MAAKHMKAIHDWAMENYEKSYGASVIVECWEEEDYLTYNQYETQKEALEWVEELVDAMNEQYAAANLDVERNY